MLLVREDVGLVCYDSSRALQQVARRLLPHLQGFVNKNISVTIYIEYEDHLESTESIMETATLSTLPLVVRENVEECLHKDILPILECKLRRFDTGGLSLSSIESFSVYEHK